jgi:hypothetical protein
MNCLLSTAKDASANKTAVITYRSTSCISFRCHKHKNHYDPLLLRHVQQGLVVHDGRADSLDHVREVFALE